MNLECFVWMIPPELLGSLMFQVVVNQGFAPYTRRRLHGHNDPCSDYRRHASCLGILTD